MQDLKDAPSHDSTGDGPIVICLSIFIMNLFIIRGLQCKQMQVGFFSF